MSNSSRSSIDDRLEFPGEALTTRLQILESKLQQAASIAEISRSAGHKSTLICPKCEATNIVKSRAKKMLDAVMMRIIPRRPYRCLCCYHRFWHSDKFAAHMH